jgi:hypothetical protein
MIFCRSNWEDISKYFSKTYMKFPEIGDEVVFVDKVTEYGMEGKFLIPTKHGDETTGWMFTFDNKEVDIDFILPKKSYFEYNGFACLLYRLPSKQFKRGLCEDNVNISCLSANGSFTTAPVSLETINAYTAKPSFKPFTKPTGQHSYVVSPRVAVDGVGRIYVDKTKIGIVVGDTKTIAISSLFEPEIKRILQGHGQYNWTVAITEKKSPVKKEAKAYEESV